MSSRPTAPRSNFLPAPLALLLALPAAAFQTQGSEPSRGQPPPAQEPSAPPARPSGGAPPSDDAFKMGSPPALPEGMTEEQMWPAATAEGWKKPVLVHWQRSFDDARRVARARNMPILVAVNMDGEIASEHFAGVRYRTPETAAQLAKYACVIASVYRHTPRDYDPEGKRVECPRFGTVTCGEHIEAERELYDTYFDGVRVSPRHLVLDLEGKETFDVYYSWDTATVFTTFSKGREGWPEPSEPPERTLVELTKSPDVGDREAVEKAYREGDAQTRRAILETLTTERVVDQVEVLRAALFGFDLGLASQARQALARCETEGALDLMAEALKAPLEASERQVLLDAVARLSKTSPRARTLGALHDGLALGSKLIEAQAQPDAAQEYEASASRARDLEARADAIQTRPNDAGALLDFAASAVARALEWPDRQYASYLIEDARSAALQAEKAGAKGPRLDGILALTSAELGERDEARRRAVAAVEGGLLKQEGGAAAEAGLRGVARVRLLRLFADARQSAIRRAYRAGESWSPEWLSDLNAAYSQLLADDSVGPAPVVEYLDFLRWIGASSRADEVLEQALARFPDSPELHERLRGTLLWQGGPELLERGYAERLERQEASGGASSQLRWFAGYASLVAAEQHRRKAEFEPATASYERGIAQFERNAQQFPAAADDCAHYVALAHAGLARVALERGALDQATEALLASFERRADSAATMDGLGITAVATAKMLKATLDERGDGQRASAVQSALDALDPKLLEPPPSELPGAGQRGRQRGGGQQGRPTREGSPPNSGTPGARGGGG
jgi:hypothetical protein